MAFPLLAWVQKRVHIVEACWLSSKEKVLGTAVSEGHTESFLTHEKTHD